jgi:hypothetical protein
MFQSVLCWNWKTAVFSVFIRAALFAVFALRAGPPAVLKAVLIEFAITAAVAGFQGALTQKLRLLEPPWRATLLCAGAVAIVNHPAEYVLHSLARTPSTPAGIALSLVYTVIATRFSLYVMRQGVFLAGRSGNSFSEDLRRVPVLIARFAGLRDPSSRPGKVYTSSSV